MSPVSTPDGTDIGPPRPSDTHRGPAPPVDRLGDRPGSLALLLLFVVPIAVAVDIFFWSRFMQIASDVWGAPPGVSGWSAVIRLLPAELLIVSPIVVGLALGVRSARLGSRRGYVAICLFVLVAVFVVGDNDNIAESSISVGTAIATLLLCLFAVRRRSHDRRTADSTDRMFYTARYRTAAALLVVGIAGAFGWLFAAQSALSGYAEGFPRAGIPGMVALAVDHPGTYYVYAEVNDGRPVEDLATDMQFARVQVTDPTGQVTALQTLPPSASYLHNFRTAIAAVRFDANRIGNYQVAVTTGLPLVTAPSAPQNANDEFAVGGSVADWMRPHEWGVAALLFATIGSSIALALRTAIQRRRTNGPLAN
jgi:hypothetical protein